MCSVAYTWEWFQELCSWTLSITCVQGKHFLDYDQISQGSVSYRTSIAQLVKSMGPTWGPPGFCRPQMGPMNLVIRVGPPLIKVEVALQINSYKVFDIIQHRIIWLWFNTLDMPCDTSKYFSILKDLFYSTKTITSDERQINLEENMSTLLSRIIIVSENNIFEMRVT